MTVQSEGGPSTLMGEGWEGSKIQAVRRGRAVLQTITVGSDHSPQCEQGIWLASETSD